MYGVRGEVVRQGWGGRGGCVCVCGLVGEGLDGYPTLVEHGGFYGIPGHRDRMTMIINSLFEKNSETGRLSITTAAPMFREVRTRSETAHDNKFHEGTYCKIFGYTIRM